MLHTPPLVTAEELERYPDDDYRYELVQGRVVRMSPVAFEHGRVVVQFGALLHQHVRSRKLGAVLTEVGFTLDRAPDTVRAPDVAFIKEERVASATRRGFFAGPPDLAVEVLSPDDLPSDVTARVTEYLERGTPVVVTIDTTNETVTVYRRLASPVTFSAADDVVDLGDVIPDFHCALRDIFE